MDIVHPRVAGIDVHKKIIWVAVRLPGAPHVRNVPGRKRDATDCQWIAELHEHGLLRTGFIPAAEVAALRQRTRYRTKLIGQRASGGQRLAKVLEDAGFSDPNP